MPLLPLMSDLSQSRGRQENIRLVIRLQATGSSISRSGGSGSGLVLPKRKPNGWEMGKEKHRSCPPSQSLPLPVHAGAHSMPFSLSLSVRHSPLTVRLTESTQGSREMERERERCLSDAIRHRCDVGKERENLIMCSDAQSGRLNGNARKSLFKRFVLPNCHYLFPPFSLLSLLPLSQRRLVKQLNHVFKTCV